MPSLEILALDTATPQIRAPGAADTYLVPRNMIAAAGVGYWLQVVGQGGMYQNGSNTDIMANSRTGVRIEATAPYGITVDYRVGLGIGVNSPDVGIERVATKVMKISDGGTALASNAGIIALPVFSVATLPVATGVATGGRSTVSDSNVAAATNFGAIVAGGGANIVPVYSDGTNWRIG